MAMWLKQSTAITVKVGPFIDPSTGDAETALTITQADVRLSVNGGNMAQKNDSTSCTHDEIGIYDCPLNATDTGTLGRIQLFIHESGALPVWHDFMVVPANVWDSMFGADKLQSHVVEFTSGVIDSAAIDATAAAEISDAVWDEALSGHTTAGSTGKALADASVNSILVYSTMPTAAAIADAVWDEALSGHTTAGSAGKALDTAATASGATPADIADAVWDEVRSGHTTDGTFGDTAEWAGGGSAPSAADIADAVWDEALSGHTSAGSAGEALDTAATASGATPSDIADAVWDEALSGHLTAGSTGNALNASGSSGDPWSTALPGAYGSGTAGKIIGDNLNATVSSRAAQTTVDDILTDTGTTLDTLIKDIPTVSEFNARTKPTADYFDPATDAVANVTTVGTVTNGVTLANGAVTAAAIATNAIDSDALAASAITEIQTGLPTAANIADAVWDEARSGHTTDGTFGDTAEWAGGGTPPTASAIADAVWDEALAGHTTGGSAGKAVADAAAISPPSANSIADTVWDEALSGHSVSGSAGKALTDAGNPFGGTNAEVSTGAEPTTHAGLLRMIYNRFYRRAELTDSTLKTYVKDATGGSSGVLTSQDVSDDGTTQIQEQSTYPS